MDYSPQGRKELDTTERLHFKNRTGKKLPRIVEAQISPRPSSIWGFCLELRSYGASLRSSCHLLTKTCLI